jgi:hypothetical protein
VDREPRLKVGDRVRVRMLGEYIDSVIHATRLGACKHMEYQIEIPAYMEHGFDEDPNYAPYVRRNRESGGFWYYASQVRPI